MEPLRQQVLSEMVGDPETLLVDSTLLSVLHPCSGTSELGVSRRRVGKVGELQRLGREALLALRHQRGPYLLRAYPFRLAEVELLALTPSWNWKYQ
jgi:hypothetical protein